MSDYAREHEALLPAIREAGAAVTDAFGEPLNFNKQDPRAFGVLVTAPAIHAAAVERLSVRAKSLAGG